MIDSLSLFAIFFNTGGVLWCFPVYAGIDSLLRLIAGSGTFFCCLLLQYTFRTLDRDTKDFRTG